MEVKQGIKIHNRFDIEVRDSITGELKQTAQAENILLDSIYTRLCGGSTYFVNIHFGTGIGTTVATRTSLFTHLGTKTAVDEELVKSIPVSSWKRKIVLAPAEYVGATITEVGIAWGSTATYLMTHAMIKDAEGNPISITKTDTDVVTIYATVYVTFDTSIPELIWISLPSSNTLMNYLIGGSTAPTGSFGLLPMIGAYARLGSTSNATWTADVANKKRKTNIPRFDINTANGNALVLEFTNLFQLSFPATGIHTGRAYTDVPLGVGDGTEDTFDLPSQNLISGTLAVKVDGVATTTLTLTEKDIFSESANPPNMPARGWAVSLSSDGTVLAVGTSNATPYLKVYTLDNGAWTERATPPNIPIGYGVALNSDGTVLAVASEVISPYIKVYDWTGTAWTERATPPNMPARGHSVSLSSDGTVLAVVTDSISPYIKVYDWTGTAWTERATPPNMPRGQAVSLSSDGTVLAVGLSVTSPYIKVYDWTGTAWTERATPPNMPARGHSVSLSSDGTVLAVVTNSISPYIKVYDWTGTAWTERATPPNMPSFGQSVSLSLNGSVLAVVSDTTSPYIKVYDWDAGWTERATLPNMPARGWAVSLSSDGTVLAVGTSITTPYLKVYNASYITQTQLKFNTPPATDTVLTADYTVKGVHKTINQVIDVSFAIQFGEGV